MESNFTDYIDLHDSRAQTQRVKPTKAFNKSLDKDNSIKVTQ